MLPKQRYLFHYGSAMLVVLTVSARMPAEDFNKITKTTPDAKTTVYRIDQPNVQHRVNEYKTITFQPGATRWTKERSDGAAWRVSNGKTKGNGFGLDR